MFFGQEFIGRIESIQEELSRGRLLIYVGDGCPTFAESYRELVADCSSQPPLVLLEEEDDAAIFHPVRRAFRKRFYITTRV